MANIERKEVDKSSLKGIPIVWVLGGPGSGKGTQCEMIQCKFGYTHLSSGELLRSEVMSGSNRGRQLFKLMSSGETVPDVIVDDILAEAMVSKAASSKGFVIDGFPMDLNQAAAFEADIGPANVIIFFEAITEVLSKRLLERGNFDDNDASVAKRLENFLSKTMPVIEKYGDKVKTINCDRPKEEVSVDVQKIMEAI